MIHRFHYHSLLENVNWIAVDFSTVRQKAKLLRKARESTAQEQSFYRCFLPNLTGFEKRSLHSPGHF
jgi:hypothetical protein